ncbi:hypothetical protein BDN72DRAFT_571931 [Pluteus cervinus]|uniref:Uncharacterized protein n=1 Tax=Pluteus cervinus TaxID=181527 RepID=A0ACD3AXB4_9AGAR|nr:hypothetical protein BDN72DRAFT_571931 [Pluteus cervinus]
MPLDISTANLISTNSPLYRFPNTKNPYVAAAVFESLLYGVYLCFGCISTYLLITRRMTVNPIFLGSAVLLFWLATTDLIYTYALLFRYILQGSITFRQLFPKYVLYVICNTIADCVLLYRCYVVWEYNRLVVAGPAMLLIATTVSGIILEATNPDLLDWSFIYLLMAVIFNTLVTALTAGRITWIRRNAKSVRNVALAERCKRTVFILIETGVMYTLYVFVDLIFHKNPAANAFLDAGLIQVVVIMPTLIMVQVGLQAQSPPPLSSSLEGSPKPPPRGFSRFTASNDPAYKPLLHSPTNSLTPKASPQSSHYTKPSIDLSYELPMPVAYTR